jgi:hypothetical protein
MDKKIDHCCNCQVLFPENQGVKITIVINQCSANCATVTFRRIMETIKEGCRECGSKKPTMFIIEKPKEEEYECYDASDDLFGYSEPVTYFDGEEEYQEE